MENISNIFKAYDIRGKVGEELTPEVCERIGRAFADWLPTDGPVAVGRDMRPDSGELADAFINGLIMQGRDVWDLGLVTSDMSYWTVGKYNLSGSAMITASHNPGKDNGVKLYRDGVVAVALDSGLDQIRDAVLANSFKPAAAVPGSIEKHDITNDWVEHCLTFVNDLKPFHIAIDAGNGMAGAILPQILSRLPIKVEEMYFELDGTFPNHEANPQHVENLQDLSKKIIENQLDFGIAFDGDGDRAALVDDKGRPVGGSDTISIVSQYMLKKYPGAKIVHEVRTSRATQELIREWGGEPVRTKAGRVNLAPMMAKIDSPFGGETTGHQFFKENYGADSGMITALVAIQAISDSGRKLSELVDEYHRYQTVPEMSFPVEDKQGVIDRLRAAFTDGKQDELDGLTVNYPDYWFNMRVSNTEPVSATQRRSEDSSTTRRNDCAYQSGCRGIIMASLRESLTYEPTELKFGTSGLRDLVTVMTDLECYLNTAGFLQFLVDQKMLTPGGTVLVGGDLRDSTPRIVGAVAQAIRDGGYVPEYHGLIPTPALAYYALERDLACLMVTGSHIPADRNGIKFYKKGGEVLKPDEAPIHAAVAAVREKIYNSDAEQAAFNPDGSLKNPAELPPVDARAEQAYRSRYLDVFPPDCLTGKKLVYYQHSAVGRDLLVGLFQKLGADVTVVGRSDVFVPIDSENVTPENKAYFKQLAEEHPDAFAIVSTDGDSDRPFVIDETGEFHRGDVLGAVTAAWCKADFASYPVSTSDAVDMELNSLGIELVRTKIGSPFIIEGMQHGELVGKQRVVAWEVNGGFMLGTPLKLDNGTLKALPTRDAFFPILIALLSANESNIKVSELFGRLPQRFTDAGLIDNFPIDVYKAMVERFGHDSPESRAELAAYFPVEAKFGSIKTINTLDGVRIIFENGDIAHLRESSNAPQLRIYSVADSQERAAEIVALAIAEPNGIFRRMQSALQQP